jgi:hypothetical protein
MKLKQFNQKTLPKQVGGAGAKTPRVSFGKAGTITFNEPACKLLELLETSKVTLSQDEDNVDNWYFYIDEVNGFALRKGYDKKGFMFNHSLLVKEVVNFFELDVDATQNFMIAGKATQVKGNPTKYWGIIKPVKL